MNEANENYIRAVAKEVLDSKIGKETKLEFVPGKTEVYYRDTPGSENKRCELRLFVHAGMGIHIAIGDAPEIDTVFWDIPGRTP